MYPFSPKVSSAHNARNTTPSENVNEVFNFKGAESLGKAFSSRGTFERGLSGFKSAKRQKKLGMRQSFASPPERVSKFEGPPSSMINYQVVEGTMLNTTDSDGLSYVPRRVESKAFSVHSSMTRQSKGLFNNAQIINAD